MNTSRLGRISKNLFQKRNMGGWIHKNIRVEENAGLREISYKTWEFNFGTVMRLSLLMFLPAALLYNGIIEEKQFRDKQTKAKRQYGFLPPEGV